MEALLVNYFILAQLSEWTFAWYIISSQRARKIEQITFDHNHEVMNEPIKKGQVSYRRKELRLWKFLKISFFAWQVIFFTMVAIIQFSDLKDKGFYYMCSILFFILLDLIMVSVIYYNIQQKMFRQHNLEYCRNIRYMRLFVVLICIICLFVVRVGLIYADEFINAKRSGWTIFYVYDRAFTHESVEEYSEYGWWIYVFVYYGNILPFISLVIIHVCFKPDDDILQGVNKLDHLLKVSHF